MTEKSPNTRDEPKTFIRIPYSLVEIDKYTDFQGHISVKQNFQKFEDLTKKPLGGAIGKKQVPTSAAVLAEAWSREVATSPRF